MSHSPHCYASSREHPPFLPWACHTLLRLSTNQIDPLVSSSRPKRVSASYSFLLYMPPRMNFFRPVSNHSSLEMGMEFLKPWSVLVYHHNKHATAVHLLLYNVKCFLYIIIWTNFCYICHVSFLKACNS